MLAVIVALAIVALLAWARTTLASTTVIPIRRPSPTS